MKTRTPVNRPHFTSNLRRGAVLTTVIAGSIAFGGLSLQSASPSAGMVNQMAAAKLGQTGPDDTWFPFKPEKPSDSSVIGMETWLDAPAGKHGGTRMVGDHFEFEDKTPVKFWGTNLAYAACAPDHETGDATAKVFAHNGINGIRLHKFSGPMGWEGIGDPNDVTKFDDKGLDNLDYFTAALAKNGVYYGFSHTFDMHVRPGNKDKVLAYNEVMAAGKGKTLFLINACPDLQDLLIASVVNLLQHKNPYTGTTYAQDPALSYIELQNEDDILFWATMPAVKKCPTYYKALQGRFSDWLQQKYSSQDGLAKAWGSELKDGETLDQKNFDMEWPGNMTGETVSPRNVDLALFLHSEQDAYYSRFVKAIRDTGYQGPICGSPWWAPEMLPSFLNLKSDYDAGYIDRHNYFGGDNKTPSDATMLSEPGSGYISTGLQQVVDRPFGISEWISCYPLMYAAEGPVLMATYGLGLQGWDSSYEFQSQLTKPGESGFGNTMGDGGNPWRVDSPTQLGQFPALSRMIFRGDVKQGDIISTRVVSNDDLNAGKFNFTEKDSQKGDVKALNGACPQAALAAGRCVVQFTDKSAPSVLPDMTKYQQGTAITSNTGELVWDSADKGFISINTAGTKAVVGFAQGKAQKLGNVTITSQTPFASIILTAMNKDETLDNAKSALLSVVGRAANGAGGKGIVVEPIQADVAITGRNVSAVNVLDQNGNRTTNSVTVNNGAFHINTGDDKTIYYEVVFQ